GAAGAGAGSGVAGADHAADTGAGADGADTGSVLARSAAIDAGCPRKPGVGAEGAGALAGLEADAAAPLPFLAARASALASAFCSARSLASALRAARRSARDGFEESDRRVRRDGDSGAWPTTSAKAGSAG